MVGLAKASAALHDDKSWRGHEPLGFQDAIDAGLGDEGLLGIGEGELSYAISSNCPVGPDGKQVPHYRKRMPCLALTPNSSPGYALRIAAMSFDKQDQDSGDLCSINDRMSPLWRISEYLREPVCRRFAFAASSIAHFRPFCGSNLRLG